MKKRKEDKRHFRDSDVEIEKKSPEQLKRSARYLLITFFNTVIAVAVYFYFDSIGFWQGFFIYAAITAVLVIAYVVYNRGFAREGVTPDMLPDTMSAVEKVEFLESRDRRKKKSKWMLTVIIPLIFTFMFDSLYLFVLPYLENLLS